MSVVVCRNTRGHLKNRGQPYIWGRGISLQVGLNGLVLLVELGEIGNEILDDVGVRQRVDLHVGLVLVGDAACRVYISIHMRFLKILACSSAPPPPPPTPTISQLQGLGHTQASQGVGAVDVHGTRAADTLSAAAAEGEGRVDLVLDADEGVENHGAGLVKIEGVGLHLGLLGGLVGVPAVDLEGLEVGLLGSRVVLLGGVGELGHAAEGRRGGGGHAKRRPRGGGAQESRSGRAESGHCRRRRLRGGCGGGARTGYQVSRG